MLDMLDAEDLTELACRLTKLYIIGVVLFAFWVGLVIKLNFDGGIYMVYKQN